VEHSTVFQVNPTNREQGFRLHEVWYPWDRGLEASGSRYADKEEPRYVSDRGNLVMGAPGP